MLGKIYFIQSTDEINEDFKILLKCSDEHLGSLIKRTWVNGEHVRFKRMLLHAHNRDQMWRSWSWKEKSDFLNAMMSEMGTASANSHETTSVPTSVLPPVGSTDEDKKQFYEQMKKFMIQSTDEADVSASHVVPGEHIIANMKSTLLEFDDSIADENINFNPITDNSFYHDATPGTELGKFLSRPVLIKTLNWSVGTPLPITNIYPWYDFFNDTRIKKKIDNFAFVSCNMRIKVVINASPFICGAAQMNYFPNPGLTPTNWYGTTTNPLIALSQCPHIMLYPQTCSGGEMDLPFFYHKNYLDLTLSSAMLNMGSITFQEYVGLSLANGGSTATCNIQVYAWATDVRLAGNTVKLALQSKDEYGVGPVSRPASAIAAIARSLSNVPLIGPFATATSIGASAVSSIASLFGYTNVPVISDVVPVKNQPFQALASSQIGVPLEKLTLDPKNELTIDPRVVGLPPKDEMSISYIVQKESYLTQFTWGSTYVPGDLLFTSTVQPLLHDRSAISDPVGSYQVYHTPMAHTQFAFYNWRGDIRYRIKFVCTKFHKGRLRVTWDPTGDIVADSVSTTVAFTKIVDLTEDEDIIINVPYMQATPWLRTRSTFGGAPYWSSGGGSFQHDSTFSNGTLTVRVLNDLTGASDLTSIQCLVYVSGCANLEFANPCSLPTNASYFQIQSRDEEDPSGQYCAPERYLLNFGEAVPSLKVLLRRTCLVDTLGFVNYGNTTAMTQIIKVWQTKYPGCYGYNVNGLLLAKGQKAATTATNEPFDYANNTPFSWFIPLFLGMRGSMHWHYNVSTSGSASQPLTSVKVARRHSQITTLVENLTSATSGSDSVQLAFFRGSVEPGAAGLAVTNQITQAGMSVSMPMYNRHRMVTTCPSTLNVGSSADDSNAESYTVVMTAKPFQSNNPFRNVHLERYASIGTDFCAYFFLTVPTMYAYNTTVVPG